MVAETVAMKPFGHLTERHAVEGGNDTTADVDTVRHTRITNRTPLALMLRLL